MHPSADVKRVSLGAPGPALLCERHTESQCGGNRGHCFPEDRLASKAINYKRQGDRRVGS